MSDFNIPDGATRIVLRLGEKVIAVADLTKREPRPLRLKINFTPPAVGHIVPRRS